MARTKLHSPMGDADAGKRVGIWIRVSTEDQANGESPEHHEHRARCYAEAKGWTVCEVYKLDAISGKSVIGLPDAKRMIEHVRTGRISGLIFSKLARLARNTRELLEFADIFRECGAGLISLQESIDTTSPAGRLFYTLIAAMAQWEREEISDRVAASVPIRAKLGKPLGGAAPFGYRWHDRKLVPDPQEAPVRRSLHELFKIHRRKKTVARLLNEAGYRTRNGSRFSDTTIERLIRDPTAKGIRRANYTKSLGARKHWTLKPEDQWVLTPVEPIISEELWTECNRLLEARRNGRRPGRRPVHLFTAYAFCICGQKLYVPSNSPKYICYRCRNKIGVDDLEAVFQEQLKRFFFSESDVADYLALGDRTLQEKEALLASLQTNLDKTKQAMDRVMAVYMAGEMTVQGFGREYGPLEERWGQMQTELPTLQAEVDFMKIRLLSSDQVLHDARDLYGRWTSLSAEEKREIVDNVVERIVVDKEEVSIELCYVPTPSEMMAGKQRGHTGSSPQSA